MYAVLVINLPGLSIAQLNAKLVTTTGADNGINRLVDLLAAIDGKNVPGHGSVQLTTRNTDPSVTTSGTGSQQVTYSRL